MRFWFVCRLGLGYECFDCLRLVMSFVCRIGVCGLDFYVFVLVGLPFGFLLFGFVVRLNKLGLVYTVF